MSQEEGNKLIAEFMGLHIYNDIWEKIDKYGEVKHSQVLSTEPLFVKEYKEGEFFGGEMSTIYYPKKTPKAQIRFDCQLLYHTSWDWLMPVVEKISSMRYPDYFIHCPEGYEREPYEDCAYPRTFGMRDKEGNYMFRFNANVLHSAKTLIEAAWLACVEFIKDYNEQNFITKPKKDKQ